MVFVIATNNSKKRVELDRILNPLGIQAVTAEQAGLDLQEVEETGSTFEENAELKALVACNLSGLPAVADDSGLVVDYLGGEPGVYSARYLGEDTSYEIKNQAIIDRLADAKEEERTARFVSTIAAVLPDGSELVTEGTVEGLIAHEPAGNGGFGYDPIFYLPEYGVTSAEIPIEKKNEISHRGKALEAMKIKLRERL